MNREPDSSTGLPEPSTVSRLREVIGMLFSYRIFISRQIVRRSSAAGPTLRPRTFSPRIAAVGTVALLGLANGIPASANTSASTTGTITVAVRSVTVSPSSIAFGSCVTNDGLTSTGSALTFPNGGCQAINITITNGTAPGHIDITGADAIPADSGTHWTLCGAVAAAGGATCANGQFTPGVDQFFEEGHSSNTSAPSPPLSTTPQCDLAFANSGGASCSATSGQVGSEYLSLEGPSSSTDNSTSFTTIWTWTAVP